MLLHHFGFFERDYLFFLDFVTQSGNFSNYSVTEISREILISHKICCTRQFCQIFTLCFFFLSSSQISSSSNWFFQLFLNTSLYYVLCGFFLRGEKFCLLSNIFAFFQPNIAHQIVFFVYFHIF